MRAYKLLRRRRNGTLGPLFINRRKVVVPGVWYDAEAHRTKGYSFRPGWHCAPTPHAPHLSQEGRVWCEVLIEDYTLLVRPQFQGGAWLLANRMCVVAEIS
jgi:hypothetical protein